MKTYKRRPVPLTHVDAIQFTWDTIEEIFDIVTPDIPFTRKEDKITDLKEKGYIWIPFNNQTVKFYIGSYLVREGNRMSILNP